MIDWLTVSQLDSFTDIWAGRWMELLLDLILINCSRYWLIRVTACTIYLFMVAVTHLDLSIDMTLCRTDTFYNNMIPPQQKQYSACSHRSMSITFTYDVFLITPSHRGMPITVTYDVYIITASHLRYAHHGHLWCIYNYCVTSGYVHLWHTPITYL